MAKRRIRIHFMIPTDKPPAPHMQSGLIPTNDSVLGNIGSGQGNACACDPRLVLSEWDRGTGDWWAVACQACGATGAFQEAKTTIPHPRAPAEGVEVEDMNGCC